jgi:hypothetical protein
MMPGSMSPLHFRSFGAPFSLAALSIVNVTGDGGAIRSDQPDTSPMTPQEINNRREKRELKEPTYESIK